MRLLLIIIASLLSCQVDVSLTKDGRSSSDSNNKCLLTIEDPGDGSKQNPFSSMLRGLDETADRCAARLVDDLGKKDYRKTFRSLFRKLHRFVLNARGNLPDRRKFYESDSRCMNASLRVYDPEIDSALQDMMRNGTIASLDNKDIEGFKNDLKQEKKALVQLVLNDLGLNVDGKTHAEDVEKMRRFRGNLEMSLVVDPNDPDDTRSYDKKAVFRVSFVQLIEKKGFSGLRGYISADVDDDFGKPTILKIEIDERRLERSLIFEFRLSVLDEDGKTVDGYAAHVDREDGHPESYRLVETFGYGTKDAVSYDASAELFTKTICKEFAKSSENSTSLDPLDKVSDNDPDLKSVERGSSRTPSTSAPSASPSATSSPTSEPSSGSTPTQTPQPAASP